jgi:hypothetical protein
VALEVWELAVQLRAVLVDRLEILFMDSLVAREEMVQLDLEVLQHL